MDEKYVVLYKRDVKTEKEKAYGARMLFDRSKGFAGLEGARRFAMENLPALLVKNYPLQQEPIVQNEQKPYVVYATYVGKYHSSCLGESEPMRTLDAVRASKEEISGLVEKLAGEKNVDTINVGLEVRLF